TACSPCTRCVNSVLKSVTTKGVDAPASVLAEKWIVRSPLTPLAGTKKRTYSAYRCAVPIAASSASGIDAPQGGGIGAVAGAADNPERDSTIAEIRPAAVELTLIECRLT